MSTLTPLIELATQKSLDLFFRVGQGYVTRSGQDGGQMQRGYGLSPLGIQSRAETRIVCALPHPDPQARLHAWPSPVPPRPRSSAVFR